VDEVEEPELPPDPPTLVPVLPVLAKAVVGVDDASVWTDEVKADVLLEEASALLLPLVFDNAFDGDEASTDPDVGVSVACDPLVVAEVRPETLCACVDVAVDC
jgi:hypothetical protein